MKHLDSVVFYHLTNSHQNHNSQNKRIWRRCFVDGGQRCESKLQALSLWSCGCFFSGQNKTKNKQSTCSQSSPKYINNNTIKNVQKKKRDERKELNKMEMKKQINVHIQCECYHLHTISHYAKMINGNEKKSEHKHYESRIYSHAKINGQC